MRLTLGLDDAAGSGVIELWHEAWLQNLSDLLTSVSGSDEPKLLEVDFNEFRDSLPLKLNVTDPNEPSLWSFTLWPRNVSYGVAKLALESWKAPYPMVIESIIVVNNHSFPLDNTRRLVTRNRNSGIAHITINSLPCSRSGMTLSQAKMSKKWANASQQMATSGASLLSCCLHSA